MSSQLTTSSSSLTNAYRSFYDLHQMQIGELVSISTFDKLQKQIQEIAIFLLLQNKSYYQTGYAQNLNSEDVDWNDQPESRELFRSCMQKIIWRISREYIQKTDTILEIGSGCVNNSSKMSYLMSFFPSFIQEKTTQSDGNPHIVRQAQSSQIKTSYIYLNFLKPPLKDSPKGSPFDKIIGCNVIDTIPEEDLITSLKTIKSLLKPKGTFIHFCDLSPCRNRFIANFCYQTEEIAFPLVDKENFIGLQCLSINSLKDGLSLIIPENHKAFLQWYINLSSLEREIMLALMLDYKEIIFKLSSLVQEYFPSNRKVFLKDYFNQKMQEVFQSAGLEYESFIEEESDIKEVNTQNPQQLAFNQYLSDQGCYIKNKIYVLQKGYMQYISRVHLIIAKHIVQK